jgi:hypothetical protein
VSTTAVEIGSALRMAREDRALELSDVERATRIRAAYLAALEEERFDRLPGRAYVKGFLRVYADFLGLDGRRLVETFNDRFPETEPQELAPPTVERARPRPSAWLQPFPVTVAFVALALAGVAAWRLTTSHHPGRAAPLRPPTTTAPAAAAPTTTSKPAHPVAWHGRLVLRARGPCWLWIRSGSASGPVLYESTLPPGGVLRYTLAAGRPQLWLRVGAPWNLDLWLNGTQIRTLPSIPANLLATRHGLSPA